MQISQVLLKSYLQKMSFQDYNIIFLSVATKPELSFNLISQHYHLLS